MQAAIARRQFVAHFMLLVLIVFGRLMEILERFVRGTAVSADSAAARIYLGAGTGKSHAVVMWTTITLRRSGARSGERIDH
jgi:hypothetical protein